jgi:hypothetical protein
MNAGSIRKPWGWWLVAALLAGSASAGPAAAQAPPAPGGAYPATAAGEADVIHDPNLLLAGCAGCGGLPPAGGFGMAGCGDHCYPGRKPCATCFDHDTAIGRLFGGLYECICCPDPCYEPKWLPVANAAFFVDHARPITHMRLRADWAFDFQFPDRAEYFWARERANQVLDNGQPCPRPSNPKGPDCPNGERSVDYREFNAYFETAVDRFGLFVEIPYRRVEADLCPCDYSGFADMKVGTKTVLLDCELLLWSFQFKTYIPIGVATKGLGNSHVSLEPSFLWTVRLSPTTYLEAQAAYWIPIAADQYYAGDIFHYHTSLNQLLWEPSPDFQLVGTWELNGWSVLDGAYTDPGVLAPGTTRPLAVDARTHMLSTGVGLRLYVCEKIDFGFGTAFAITDEHFEDQIYRAEFRWRY